jgi:hypothetical protein
MLISDERRFIFVHIQKTGGETITDLLSRRVPDLRPLAAKHARLCDRGSEITMRDYFIFAFVRNPWDRLVSWYSMIQAAQAVQWTEAQGNARKRSQRHQTRLNKLWRYAITHSDDFKSFVRNCTQPVEMQAGVHYSFSHNQLDYVTDQSGLVIADFIGRFERFNDDVEDIFLKLGLGSLTELPHENPSQHEHYTGFYDDETEEIVRQRFARDIEYFGYSFRDAG